MKADYQLRFNHLKMTDRLIHKIKKLALKEKEQLLRIKKILKSKNVIDSKTRNSRLFFYKFYIN